ncbi:MAG: TetR/AcrR family transcriptional regulator C-terminal domain-containing protein [Erysipelotrichales bacterium]|nr:TetR/AcrR family transcriptional regulator C-terminal domain-containing protein [Erysipelotrichales bacterium]
MEQYTKISMKDLLAQSLYVLMQNNTFEKITIKQITTKAGVIRGTFYNHFFDKYEALEYLVTTILINNNTTNLTSQESPQLLKDILKNIEDDKKFFIKCFAVEGQNGFDGILENVFTVLFNRHIKKQNIEINKLDIEIDLLTKVYSKVFVFVIKNWLQNDSTKTYIEIYDLFKTLFSKSVKEVILNSN